MNAMLRSRFLRIICMATAMVILSPISLNLIAQTPQPNVYNLEMTIERDGSEVFSPKVQLAHGKPARLSIEDPNKKDGNMRLQVIASPGSSTISGAPTVNISLMILETVGGSWVVVGEPALVAYDGKEASVGVNGGIASYNLKLKATAAYNPMADLADLSQCGDILAPTDTPMTPAMADCCTVRCADGSGVLTCCGAVQCWACGSTCIP